MGFCKWSKKISEDAAPWAAKQPTFFFPRPFAKTLLQKLGFLWGVGINPPELVGGWIKIHTSSHDQRILVKSLPSFFRQQRCSIWVLGT